MTHFAGDHIHTDKIKCNIEEPQRKYRLATVSYRLLVELKYVFLDSISHPLLPLWFETFFLHEGFPSHQRINTGNKQITDNAIDESRDEDSTKTMYCDTWISVGCQTTSQKYGSKAKETTILTSKDQTIRLSTKKLN